MILLLTAKRSIQENLSQRWKLLKSTSVVLKDKTVIAYVVRSLGRFGEILINLLRVILETYSSTVEIANIRLLGKVNLYILLFIYSRFDYSFTKFLIQPLNKKAKCQNKDQYC